MTFLPTEGELIPAATVIPLRDARPERRLHQARGADAAEELQARLRRHVGVPGRADRPGGLARRRRPRRPGRPGPGGLELAAARTAAAREAMEEADLLVQPDDMVLFSHWTPPEMEAMSSTKRFSTWFFVCRAPVGQDGVVTIDMGEIHEDEWVRPAEMLARRDAGEIQLVPPPS